MSPTASSSTDQENCPFDLRWAAWGAAVETLQIDLVANGWMGLFAAMLESDPSTELRWRGSGPGTNAEVKRAYSALYGRFFGRAALREDHGCRWLVQVQHGLELAPGVQLRRRSGSAYAGDLPDWVGWDESSQGFVLAEAKGSHDKGNWHAMHHPQPIKTALNQLERMEIVDATGPIHFKTWAVASRWGTEENGLQPTLITVDPDIRGRVLKDEERERLRSELRARWVASLLDGLARPDLARAVRSADAVALDAFDTELTVVAGRKGYAALSIEHGGMVPLVGANRLERMRALIETARALKRETALILLDRDEVLHAMHRSGGDAEKSETIDEDQTPDAITIDGVTFQSNADDIEIA